MAYAFVAGANAQFLSELYGGLVEPRITFPVTGAAMAEVLGNDPDALAVIFVNTGANPVFLNWRQDQGAAVGVQLGANGGGTSLNVRDDGPLPAMQIFAASPAGASSLLIVRLRRLSEAPKA